MGRSGGTSMSLIHRWFVPIYVNKSPEADLKQIHISKAEQGEEEVKLAGKAKKLMHRFTEEQIHQKMDEVEKN
jgi:hypothetical protein